jgi:hypothetical protein
MQVTDSAALYNTAVLLSHGYWHRWCNHSAHQRSVPYLWTIGMDRVGTQVIEQEWNQLRRFIRDNYVDTCILDTTLTQLYIDEFSFRRNHHILHTHDPTNKAFEQVCKMIRRTNAP